jgi:hypothetical protein
MGALKVGIREFRDKRSTYLLESESPVAIARHGNMVGYFIPARRTRTAADKAALEEAAARRQEVLTAQDISEDATLGDFKLAGEKHDNRPEASLFRIQRELDRLVRLLLNRPIRYGWRILIFRSQNRVRQCRSQNYYCASK